MFWHKEQSNIQSEIPESTKVHSHCWIGKDVKIGENCKIQAFAFIPTGVEIEDDCFIGPNVTFTNDHKPPSGKWEKTFVRKGAVIGASCTILPGIEIGEKAMIGGGSVVTKNVPAGEVWFGNPATKVHKVVMQHLIDILQAMPDDVRKKMGKMDFEMNENFLQIIDGKFVIGRYFNASRTIVINPLLVGNKEHLKRVIKHELGHSVGLSENDLRRMNL